MLADLWSADSGDALLARLTVLRLNAPRRLGKAISQAQQLLAAAEGTDTEHRHGYAEQPTHHFAQSARTLNVVLT
jgi:hypothetical protein